MEKKSENPPNHENNDSKPNYLLPVSVILLITGLIITGLIVVRRKLKHFLLSFLRL